MLCPVIFGSLHLVVLGNAPVREAWYSGAQECQALRPMRAALPIRVRLMLVPWMVIKVEVGGLRARFAKSFEPKQTIPGVPPLHASIVWPMNFNLEKVHSQKVSI